MTDTKINSQNILNCSSTYSKAIQKLNNLQTLIDTNEKNSQKAITDYKKSLDYLNKYLSDITKRLKIRGLTRFSRRLETGSEGYQHRADFVKEINQFVDTNLINSNYISQAQQNSHLDDSILSTTSNCFLSYNIIEKLEKKCQFIDEANFASGHLKQGSLFKSYSLKSRSLKHKQTTEKLIIKLKHNLSNQIAAQAYKSALLESERVRNILLTLAYALITGEKPTLDQQTGFYTWSLDKTKWRQIWHKDGIRLRALFQKSLSLTLTQTIKKYNFLSNPSRLISKLRLHHIPRKRAQYFITVIFLAEQVTQAIPHFETCIDQNIQYYKKHGSLFPNSLNDYLEKDIYNGQRLSTYTDKLHSCFTYIVDDQISWSLKSIGVDDIIPRHSWAPETYKSHFESCRSKLIDPLYSYIEHTNKRLITLSNAIIFSLRNMQYENSLKNLHASSMGLFKYQDKKYTYKQAHNYTPIISPLGVELFKSTHTLFNNQVENDKQHTTLTEHIKHLKETPAINFKLKSLVTNPNTLELSKKIIYKKSEQPFQRLAFKKGITHTCLFSAISILHSNLYSLYTKQNNNDTKIILKELINYINIEAFKLEAEEYCHDYITNAHSYALICRYNSSVRYLHDALYFALNLLHILHHSECLSLYSTLYSPCVEPLIELIYDLLNCLPDSAAVTSSILLLKLIYKNHPNTITLKKMFTRTGSEAKALRNNLFTNEIIYALTRDDYTLYAFKAFADHLNIKDSLIKKHLKPITKSASFSIAEQQNASVVDDQNQLIRQRNVLITSMQDDIERLKPFYTNTLSLTNDHKLHLLEIANHFKALCQNLSQDGSILSARRHVLGLIVEYIAYTLEKLHARRFNSKKRQPHDYLQRLRKWLDIFSWVHNKKITLNSIYTDNLVKIMYPNQSFSNGKSMHQLYKIMNYISLNYGLEDFKQKYLNGIHTSLSRLKSKPEQKHLIHLAEMTQKLYYFYVNDLSIHPYFRTVILLVISYMRHAFKNRYNTNNSLIKKVVCKFYDLDLTTKKLKIWLDFLIEINKIKSDRLLLTEQQAMFMLLKGFKSYKPLQDGRSKECLDKIGQLTDKAFNNSGRPAKASSEDSLTRTDSSSSLDSLNTSFDVDDQVNQIQIHIKRSGTGDGHHQNRINRALHYISKLFSN